MTGLARRFAAQLAHPRGVSGRLLGMAMDIANRASIRWAVHALALRDGERVLDAGCGTGAGLAEALSCAEIRACGIDPSRTMIAAARRRLGGQAELHVADTAVMPFAEASFDAVMALNLLYFCDADSRMVADLRRMLKPSGRLVAYVTDRVTMEAWPFAHAGYHRLFDARALRATLALGGFAPDRTFIHARTVMRGITGLLAIAER